MEYTDVENIVEFGIYSIICLNWNNCRIWNIFHYSFELEYIRNKFCILNLGIWKYFQFKWRTFVANFEMSDLEEEDPQVLLEAALEEESQDIPIEANIEFDVGCQSCTIFLYILLL